MKKVLIVAYYWPPSGGGGVQRWVKFAKYLRDYDWEPIIFIPENPEYPILDESLIDEVPKDLTILKCPIWEPYKYYRIFSGDKSKTVSAGFVSNTSRVSFRKRIATWIRGNIFIPDARKFWIKPATKQIIKYFYSNGFDAIISTGPPHSMHLIAHNVKKQTKVKWLADFRDPWMDMDNEEELNYSEFVKRKHQILENLVLDNANLVVTVSWYLSAKFSAQRGKKVETLTNGFDPIDIHKATNDQSIEATKFIIGHYGTLGSDRNPKALWQALSIISKKNPHFKNKLVIELVGPTDATIIQDISNLDLSENLVHIPYVKHIESVSKMKRTNMLLVVLNDNKNVEGRVTGKIFEYIATSNTVLGIGSTSSDCAKVIELSNSGKMIDFNDKKKIISFISSSFEKQNDSNHIVTPNRKEIDESRLQFTRQNLTKQLAEYLEKL